MKNMDDCVFCKIAKGDMESNKVYEDNEVLAFLDINPVTKGHTLVIPKKHYIDIFDIPEQTLKQVISAAKKVAQKLYDKLDADGINLQNSNKPAANQVVPHYHMHVIPRYKGDGIRIVHGSQKGDKKDFEKIMKRLG